jgi:uncharacterized membrane protein
MKLRARRRSRPDDLLDRAFEGGIILKGLDGVLEMLGGLLLVLVSPATIDRIITTLTQHELSEDPHDFIATHLLKTAHGLTAQGCGSAPSTCCRTGW